MYNEQVFWQMARPEEESDAGNELYRPPAVVTWTNASNAGNADALNSDNRGSAAAHQLIHGLPASPRVQSLEVIKVASEEDEGYATASSPHTPKASAENSESNVNNVGNVGNGSSNLLWLLDFKLDFFNEANNENNNDNNNGLEHVGKEIVVCTSGETLEKSLGDSKNNDNNVAEKNEENGENASKDFGRKPPFTYTDLITQALRDKRALTVSGIYAWITEKYGYFKSDDDRWKNSVRHNLSMNPHFRKGDKAKHGAGHLWVLATDDHDELDLAQVDEDSDETARAVQSILGKESRLIDQMRRQAKRGKENSDEPKRNRKRPKTSKNNNVDLNNVESNAKKRDMDSMSLLDGRLRQVMLRRESMASPPTLCIEPHKVHLGAEEGLESVPSKSVVVEATPASHFVFSPMEQMEELDYHVDANNLDKTFGMKTIGKI